jgi:hypothetical protein
MMNIIKVQDSLKNFSEDQLIKEMQQPTGNAPQFLVLSELNRRKRVKGDFEARQAENQPTVAEEAVAAAGVPQDQMMGMPEAMAPQSAVSEGVGTSAPMKMATGGLAQFGQEIRSGMGQDIDPYLDGVQNEAEQKFGVQLGQLGQGNMNIQPSIYQQPMPIGRVPGVPGYRGPSQFPTQDPRGPRIPDSMGGIGGKGMPRPAVMHREYLRGDVPFRGGAEMKYTTTSMADGGVVRAANGFRGVGQGGYDTRGDAFRSPGDPTISDDFENTGNVDVGGLFGFGQEDARTLQEILKSGPKTMEELEILEKSEKETEARSPLPITQEVPEKPNIQTEVEVDSANKPLTIEEELLKRQAGLDKSKNFDKWMALAQAGMGILSSNSPTLAGAIGEGGTAGLTAFSEANKRYEDGLTDVLNARSKMETARLTAEGKGRLTRSSAIQAINTYNTSISSKEKLIQDLMKDNYGNITPEVQRQIDAIKKSIADLTYQQSQLFGAGEIRPRPSINVGKLPSTQKAS